MTGRAVVFRGSPTGKIGEALKFQQDGDNRKAERIYRRILKTDPANVNALHLLGLLLHQEGNSTEAVSLIRRAVSYAPTKAELYLNLGVIFESRMLYTEALASYTRARKLDPDNLYVHFNLGILWGTLAEHDMAAACFEQATKVAPDVVAAQDNHIFVLDLASTATPADRLAARRRWNDVFAASVIREQLPHRNDPDPERRLRVGYVSADFRQHSAWLTFSPVMLEHDREQFDVYAYSGWEKDDDTATGMLKAAGVHWRNTAGHDDASVAQMVRDDGIDVLVDLSGFTAGNRLMVFARKPAPIQVSGWGYATGLALDCMDGFFTDRIVFPETMHDQVTEPPLYLSSLIAYNPPSDALPVNPLPALAHDGMVTFGSFNQPKKLTTASLKLWARVLKAVPNSRMVLKHAGLDQTHAETRIRDHFEEEGVETGRLHLFGHSPHHHHVAAFADVDIQLDPTPHGGGVTTLEGLMMGVPTLTMLGDRISANVSGSLMTTLGLPEYVTTNEDEFIARAVALAADLPRLAEVRAGLRTRLLESIICEHAEQDGKIVRTGRRYCAEVESHYRRLWGDWCAARQPALAAAV